ncbi:MAG TPA: ABC transporter substrate-binding protein [Candidatus Baltobacteraceae bacterium]|nr:ABC transporter substrate-binding protein [Candidatus Baltobacteraceae bacterium]
MRSTHKSLAVAAIVCALFAGADATRVASQTEPGITPTEILLGGTHPFSGPASAYGAIGKGAEAYFSYVNDKGGVNGRKITYKDLDDGYNPTQALQLTKQLVEQDGVFAMFNTLGTAVNTALRPYLNERGVPQLFVASGASTWGAEGARYPWTIGWQPDYQSESIVYAHSLLAHNSNPKIGVLYQNDDYGQDYLTGLQRGLGSKTNLIVKSVSYEVTDPDVTSQIASLKSSGADTLFIFATPKFSTQALVAVNQQAWHPVVYLNSVSNSQSVMRAATTAGTAAATNGVITTIYLKDPSDAALASDPGIVLYKSIMTKYLPSADASNGFYLFGMSTAFTMVDALEKAGKNPTRRKVIDAALHLNEHNNQLVMNGIFVQTTPAQRFPITQEQLVRYDAGKWVASGPIVDARAR